MSTDLIFGGVALLIDRAAGIKQLREAAPETSYLDDLFFPEQSAYLLLEQVGNNRTFDMQGRIAKSIWLEALGTARDCIVRAARCPGDFEGGCIRFAKSRETKIEAYIAWCRGLIESPCPITALHGVLVQMRVHCQDKDGKPLDLRTIPGSAAFIDDGSIAPLDPPRYASPTEIYFSVQVPAHKATAVLTWLTLIGDIHRGAKLNASWDGTDRLYEEARLFKAYKAA